MLFWNLKMQEQVAKQENLWNSARESLMKVSPETDTNAGPGRDDHKKHSTPIKVYWWRLWWNLMKSGGRNCRDVGSQIFGPHVTTRSLRFSDLATSLNCRSENLGERVLTDLPLVEIKSERQVRNSIHFSMLKTYMFSVSLLDI